MIDTIGTIFWYGSSVVAPLVFILTIFAFKAVAIITRIFIAISFSLGAGWFLLGISLSMLFASGFGPGAEPIEGQEFINHLLPLLAFTVVITFLWLLPGFFLLKKH
jgi:hypothetical protein